MFFRVSIKWLGLQLFLGFGSSISFLVVISFFVPRLSCDYLSRNCGSFDSFFYHSLLCSSVGSARAFASNTFRNDCNLTLCNSSV